MTRGSYASYVSTAKRRERRWRLFSTFPIKEIQQSTLCNELETQRSSHQERQVICFEEFHQKKMYHRLRHIFFNLLRNVSQTSDAKNIAADTLDGLLQSSARSVLQVGYHQPLPYSDLGESCSQISTAQRSDIVFITGRFRSGSTLLWNVFRQMENCTAYYEPFNERRWFDPSARGNRMDATHRGVSDYWKEYDGLEELAQYFSDDWPAKGLLMDAQSWNPAMKRFIEIMVERSRGRPILQFNRIDFRLPWIRHYFPHAKIIHLFRHPRDEWFSCLFHERCQNKDCSLQEFFECEGFYLQAWSQDLQYHFPFLAPTRIRHPYHLFYFIWRLSYLYGMQFSHHSIAYEHLIESPRQALTDMFHVLDIQYDGLDLLASLIDPRQTGRWKQYADEAWFREQEAMCELTIEEFIGKEHFQMKPVSV